MKLKFGLVLISVFALSTFTQAGRNYGAAGCGPGSMAVGASGNQFLAMLIDDAFFLGYVPGAVGSLGALSMIKTFAITTGTSNCKDDGVALNSKEQEQYVDANYQSLMQEMAQGNGEHLEALQIIMECDGQNSSLFSSVMQENYSEIFPSSSEKSGQVLNSVKSVIKTNDVLTKSCKLEEV